MRTPEEQKRLEARMRVAMGVGNEIEEQQRYIAMIAIGVGINRLASIVAPDDPLLTIVTKALGADVLAMASMLKAGRDQHYGRRLCARFRREPDSVIELCGLDAGHDGECDFDHEPAPPTTPTAPQETD